MSGKNEAADRAAWERGAPLHALLVAACLLLSGAGGCEEPRRYEQDEEGQEGEAECPGRLEGARCIKACSLAVETLATSGISYEIHSESGQVQPFQSPQVTYSVETFLISGGYLLLDLPRPVLTDLEHHELTPPVCFDLASEGSEGGFAQYIPAGSTFSTDEQRGGTVAIIDYNHGSAALEGIFSFDAVMESGGGHPEEEIEDRWVTHIEQGYFRAFPN